MQLQVAETVSNFSTSDKKRIHHLEDYHRYKFYPIIETDRMSSSSTEIQD
jgi:hypothetical protein